MAKDAFTDAELKEIYEAAARLADIHQRDVQKALDTLEREDGTYPTEHDQRMVVYAHLLAHAEVTAKYAIAMDTSLLVLLRVVACNMSNFSTLTEGEESVHALLHKATDMFPDGKLPPLKFLGGIPDNIADALKNPGTFRWGGEEHPLPDPQKGKKDDDFNVN